MAVRTAGRVMAVRTAGRVMAVRTAGRVTAVRISATIEAEKSLTPREYVGRSHYFFTVFPLLIDLVLNMLSCTEGDLFIRSLRSPMISHHHFLYMLNEQMSMKYFKHRCGVPTVLTRYPGLSEMRFVHVNLRWPKAIKFSYLNFVEVYFHDDGRKGVCYKEIISEHLHNFDRHRKHFIFWFYQYHYVVRNLSVYIAIDESFPLT
jgi:hypothetical protein